MGDQYTQQHQSDVSMENTYEKIEFAGDETSTYNSVQKNIPSNSKHCPYEFFLSLKNFLAESKMIASNELLMQQKGYSGGFKFDHVWYVMKDYVQSETAGGVSSFPKENIQESPISPNPSLSSFSINLSDENISGGSSSHRPEGVKKSKLKRKQSEDASNFANTVKEENAKLRELLLSSISKKERVVELEMKKIEAQNRKSKINELMREDNILMMNLDNISDPERREFFRLEQQQIMQKRRQTQQPNSSNDMFGDFFPDLGGSGSGLPDY
ncbi:hypothetical protein DH2020_042398 [Rehmannia glutinosa]|uniref:No apical meristem-associated C-terminal domain-containing protein n=1 Tax=Rehmannia glutinosa TaxID=99300 RepID=A0ABR0UMG7_REHGL